MNDVENISQYLPTSPCTECTKYNECREHFISTAKEAGKFTDETPAKIESMMSSRVGVCDDFEEVE